ncbi:MAG: extracellular solute-binding protein, partial [Patescibacteria group bacterium]|nr:extracellular solute-binding protein [Patescibacteria group bacterium]
LTYYRLWDNDDTLDDIIASYEREHKNVKIEVRKIPIAEEETIYEYQNDLIKEIADDKGPDMFMIHNDWLPYQINQIYPAPSSVISLEEYQEKYPEVAIDDFVESGKIYAMPYFIDNLILYYNIDLFHDADIPRSQIPPKTWSDVVEVTPKLTKFDRNGLLTQSAINMGVDNEWVPRFAEIIAALIYQNGGQMTTSDHTKTIFDLPVTDDKPYYPGENALEFYTDFANPNSSLYTYSDATYTDGSKKFPSDIQAFLEGKLAMYVGYAYQIENIRDLKGSFQFDTTLLPQSRSEEPATIANYWGETVSRNSDYPQVAWDFINYVSQKSNLRSYVRATGHVGASNELIKRDLNRPYYGPVAKQVEHSKSWYRSNTPEIEDIFADMVNSVLHYRTSAKQAIESAVNKINGLN